MGSASLVLVKVSKANTPVPFVPLLRTAKRSETGVFVVTRTRCSMCLAQVVTTARSLHTCAAVCHNGGVVGRPSAAHGAAALETVAAELRASAGTRRTPSSSTTSARIAAFSS